MKGPSGDALKPHDYDGCWECDEGCVANVYDTKLMCFNYLRAALSITFF